MPEHAPRFKTPCPIIKTKKTPLNKKRAIACPPSLFIIPRIQEYTLYTTDARGVDALFFLPTPNSQGNGHVGLG